MWRRMKVSGWGCAEVDTGGFLAGGRGPVDSKDRGTQNAPARADTETYSGPVALVHSLHDRSNL